MTRKALFIAALMGLGTVAHAQQYQMDVETVDGLFTSYLVSDMQAVAYEDGKTIITLDNNSKKTYNNEEIKSLSWSEYKGSATETSGTYKIDENHLSIVTSDYSIEFSPMAIDKEMTLTVTKSSGTPSLLPEGSNTVVAYDFSLGDKHDLDGVAVIRLPMKVTPGYTPMGAYYNETTGKWQAVNGTYYASTGEMVIKTRHLSKYAGIEIQNARTTIAMMIYHFVPIPTAELALLGDLLNRIAHSDEPEAEGIEMFGSQYSDVSQLGIDVGFNSLLALGFGSTALEKFSELLGHFGVALSVYHICRSDFKGDDAQKAGATMKLCMQQAIYWANYYCGNAILTASLASVAMIDYCINKFATTAWSSRKDFYRDAMWEFYNKYENKKFYRSAKDWYKIIKPIMARKDLTIDQIHELVDKEVCDYCNLVWTNKDDYLTWYEAEKGVKFNWNSGTVVCKELFDEMRSELYNGELVSVFRFIKIEKEQDAYDMADEQMEKYVGALNQKVILQLVDKSMANEKSAYKGYTVRFKNLPNTIEDPQNWECVLDEKGEGKIQYTIIAQHDGGVKPTLELVEPGTNGKVVNEIPLSNLNTGTNTINVAPNNARVEPAVIEIPAEGAVRTAKYYFGDYISLGRQMSDAARAWINASWSDNNKYPDELIVCVGPNTTKEERQDTIKMGFTMVKGSPFNERFIIPVVIKQAAGPHNVKNAKSYLVGDWRYTETVKGSYDVNRDYLLTFKSDGTYKEIRKEVGVNYDYKFDDTEEGTYEVTEIIQESTNRMRLKVKMTYKNGASSREAQFDVYAHRIFYWQPRLHYYDRE